MDPAEVEFLAEKEMVSIIPNFNFDRIFLISGEIGPFRAGLPVKVPIWMAINLRQRQKCRIIPPDWMDVDKLLEVKEIESQSRFFTKMPSEHYMVEARLLLGAAAEDITRTDEIRTVLKVSKPFGYAHTCGLGAVSRTQCQGWSYLRDYSFVENEKYFVSYMKLPLLCIVATRAGKLDIWDMRMSKLRTSVDAFIRSGSTHARLDHLTQMELCSVRPLLPDALDQLHRLQKIKKLFTMSPGQGNPRRLRSIPNEVLSAGLVLLGKEFAIIHKK
ncbi:unnamed protein product [Timema podura]|uniref:DNA replication complex GINS protein PSF2 n=1 Tax=Timema podura TaxID=61482 RepID=A0ABN7NI74_TIMPD|nr:unnamed protein product [Timema podura]